MPATHSEPTILDEATHGGGASSALGTKGPIVSVGLPRSRWRDGDKDERGSGTKASLIVVMGVSGTGKSTLGTALAGRMGLPFIDGDDLHPAANVAKMSRGEPLDDADRGPWLTCIRSTAVRHIVDQLGLGRGRDRVGEGLSREHGDTVPRQLGVVVACSSLKKTYRAVLRGQGAVSEEEGEARGVSLSTWFVYLKGDREVLMSRMLDRQGHFMKAGMLESQLETLESPEGEPDVVTVSVALSTEEQVKQVVEALGSPWL